jgi:ADP-heptose:LPS heptosyltransferase
VAAISAGGDRLFRLHPVKLPRVDAAWLERRGATELEAELGSFAQALAWVAQMDGVVGVDSPIIHLAAALGKPVWVLLGPRPHWRWLRDRANSPWYPTASLFRRAESENWKAVIGRVKPAIRASLVA